MSEDFHTTGQPVERMSKQKTAMHELKDILISMPCRIDTGLDVWIDKEAVINIINEMLDSERQAIEQAVWWGSDNREPMIYPPESYASDYFNETYEI